MTAIEKPKYREAQWEPRLYHDNPEPQPLLYTPHVCATPENWTHEMWRTDCNAKSGGHPVPESPRYPENAIWQCPECRRYYHYIERDYGIASRTDAGRYWYPVCWWNFTAKRHIKEAQNSNP